MSIYVLIHGAWGGAWCWADVAGRLRAHGHTVFAPDLTGLGARAHLAGQHINLSTHIQDVVAVLTTERLEDVILVGHSYGGMVITGAAAQAASRIRRLLYVDAFLPSDGDSVWTLSGEAQRAWLIDSASRHGGRTARLQRPNDIARDETRFVTQSIACFIEAVQLSGAEQAIPHRTYLHAANYANSPFTPVYHRLQSTPGWRLAQTATGHNAMLEDPAGLTAELLKDA
jgi:pimeloyl-ACP methyl ester carboxylesterase